MGAWARLFSDRGLIEVPRHHACETAQVTAEPFRLSQLPLRGWLGTKCPQVYKYVWE